MFYGFIIGAASIGGPVDEAGMEAVTAYLQTEVSAGHIEFVTAAQLVERYHRWEETGDVPQGQ